MMVRISTVVKWEGSTDGYGDRGRVVMMMVTDDSDSG